jgi:hypothetical protein
LLVATGGMFTVLSLWVLVQNRVRRASGCQNPDKDVLEFMLQGCGGGCRNQDSCHSQITIHEGQK